MLITTKGIVLHTMDYAETGIITRIYTEHLGLQSYLVRSVRKKGAKLKRNLFTPLSILHLVVSHKETEGLRSLREASVAFPLYGINRDVIKSTVALFMSEVLMRATTPHLTDKNLYDYLEKTIVELNDTKDSLGSFPLIFCMQLMRFLGCMPHNNFDALHPFFNLKEGVFCASAPENAAYQYLPLSAYFSMLLNQPDREMGNIEYDARKALLNLTLDYLKEQIPGFGTLKSLSVLHDVLT